MFKSITDSFIHEIALMTSPQDERELDKIGGISLPLQCLPCK